MFLVIGAISCCEYPVTIFVIIFCVIVSNVLCNLYCDEAYKIFSFKKLISFVFKTNEDSKIFSLVFELLLVVTNFSQENCQSA